MKKQSVARVLAIFGLAAIVLGAVLPMLSF
jgi:hypothetical protein